MFTLKFGSTLLPCKYQLHYTSLIVIVYLKEIWKIFGWAAEDSVKSFLIGFTEFWCPKEEEGMTIKPF